RRRPSASTPSAAVRWPGLRFGRMAKVRLEPGNAFPLKRHLFLGQKPLDQIDRLCVAADPKAVVQSHDLKLVLLPAWRDTQDCASAAGSIEKGHLLGNVARII